MCVTGLDYKKYDYNFCVNDEIIVDKYAKALSGKSNGEKRAKILGQELFQMNMIGRMMPL